MLNNLKDLLLKELRDLYDAEVRSASAIPKLKAAATDAGLKETVSQFGVDTENHVLRVVEACEQLDATPKGETCEATRGLIRECEALIEEPGDPMVGDAALISGLQRIMHYKIAGYGCAVTFAENLDLEPVALLLRANLGESKTADEDLTEIAKGGLLSTGINEKAVHH